MNNTKDRRQPDVQMKVEMPAPPVKPELVELQFMEPPYATGMAPVAGFKFNLVLSHLVSFWLDKKKGVGYIVTTAEAAPRAVSVKSIETLEEAFKPSEPAEPTVTATVQGE